MRRPVEPVARMIKNPTKSKEIIERVNVFLVLFITIVYLM
jgi:hypothetical protein